MIREEFHVGRAVKEDLSGDGRQRVSQVAQLVLAVGEAAVVLELANAGLFVVTAHLSLVVRVHSTNIMATRIVGGHRLNKR